jgi:DnaJ homolog subfamily B member 11
VPQVCDECPEVELEQQTVTLSLDIEPGMEGGTVITLYQEGEPHADGDPGDLNVVLALVPHKTLKREKLDLKVSVQISLVDALAGFRHEIEHLDGHKVSIHASALHACPLCLFAANQLVWSRMSECEQRCG